MALNSQLTSLIYSGSMKVLLIHEKRKNREAVGYGMVFSSLVYKRYVSVRLGTLSQSLKKYFKMSHFKIISGDSHSKIGCLEEV